MMRLLIATCLCVLLNGKMDRLVEAFRRDAWALSHDFPLYTSEVRYNDRVLVRPYRWFVVPGVAPDTPTASDMWTMSKLYSSVTGDLGTVRLFPLKPVRWLTSPCEIAALVDHADPSSLRAQLFHFGEKPRKLAARLFLLKPGAYTVELTARARDKDEPGRRIDRKTLEVKQDGEPRVDLELPPRQLCEFVIRPNRAADSNGQRGPE
jgi:hypothetical protein